MQDDAETLQEEMENNCLTALYLIMILTKVSEIMFFQKYHIYWDKSDQYQDIVKISKDGRKQNIDRLRWRRKIQKK